MTEQEIRSRLDVEHERLIEVREALVKGGFVGQAEGDATAGPSTVDQHPAEIGTEAFTMGRDQSLLEQIRSDLDDVDSALARLEQGTYGLCEACGGPIGEDRLEVVPSARFCLEHEQMTEGGATGPARTGDL